MSNDILDSRDLNNRLEELQSEFNVWKDSLTPEQIADFKEEYSTPEDEDLSEEEYHWAWEDEVGSDALELKNLISLREQFDREWFSGIQFVKDSYFEEFARDEAENIGAYLTEKLIGIGVRFNGKLLELVYRGILKIPEK